MIGPSVLQVMFDTHLHYGFHVFADELLLQHADDRSLRTLIQVVGGALTLLVDPRLHLLDVNGRAVLRQKLLTLHLSKSTSSK